MEAYGPLFQRLEDLKREMERSAEREGETAELLKLRKQLLSLELEITDLRLRELEAAPAPESVPTPEPAASTEPVPRGEEPKAGRADSGGAAPTGPEPFVWSEPEPAAPPSPGKKPAGKYAYVYADGSRPRGESSAPAQGRAAPPPRAQKPVHRPARHPGEGGAFLGMPISESSIGKYILSLLACLLILLGCCVLILMGWSHMSRLVKAAVIALGGGGFVAAGLRLAKRLPKPFSDSLTACGLGLLYADVVALYQAWALVPLWGALFLILAWDGACLYLGRRGHTRIFFYVLGLGNFITAALVCQLLSDSPLSAVSLLFVGCTQAGAILAYHRVYGKFDPVLALAAGATALYADLAHLGAVYRWWRGYVQEPGAWLLLSLALCLGLSWLLMWSAGRIVDVKSKGGARAVYLCLVLPVLLASFSLGGALGYYAAAHFASAALRHHLPLLLAAAGAAGLLAVPRFRREGYCIFAPVLLATAESLGRYYGFDASGAGLAALGALGVYALRRTKLSQWVCALAYGAFCLLLWYIPGTAPYYVALVPGLLFPALLLYLWREGESGRRVLGVTLCTYAAALVLLRGVELERDLPALVLLLLLGGLLAALPLALRDLYAKHAQLALHGRIQDFAYAAVLLFYTQLLRWSLPGIWTAALAALLLFLHGLKLVYLAYFRWRGENQTAWGIAAAAVCTLSVLQGARLTPAGDWPIFLSLLCIALSAGYVVLGFCRMTKPLRIFGLVLSIASVVKMVTLDVVGSPSLFRVAALVAGGLLCLGISFVYYWMEQRQAKLQVNGKKGANDQ